jgi:hypothetical protein
MGEKIQIQIIIERLVPVCQEPPGNNSIPEILNSEEIKNEGSR